MRYRKFNVDKELKKIKFKRNREKYFKLGIFVICIIGVIIVSIYFTKSTYYSNTTYLPVNNKIEEFKAYDYLIAAYINNEETFSYPLKNTGYELDSFNCDNAVGSWNRDSWSLNLTNISARTKCNLYFRNATYSLKYYIGDTEVSTIPSSSDYNFTSASCDNGASISFNTDTWSPTVSNVLGDNVCSLKFEDKITIINFTIDYKGYNGTTETFQAEEGMTWEEWVSSSYNTRPSRYGISTSNYHLGYMVYSHCNDGDFDDKIFEIYNDNYGTYKNDKIINGASYIADPKGPVMPC